MIERIGELISSKNETMLKMWEVDVNGGKRPYRRHCHTQFEISLILNGEGEYTTKRSKFKLHKDDIVVFSSNELHNISEVGENGLSILNMHFEPRYLSGSKSDLMGQGYMNFCFTHSPDFSNLILSETAAPIRNLMFRIKDELMQNKPERNLAIKSYLNLIVISLIREFNYKSDEQVPTTQVSNMLKATKFIDRNISEKLSLEEIAAVAGVSPNYFSAMFKQLNGTALWDYISAKRIEKAIGLILDDNEDMTMLSVALECGFNSTANFNKIFKKQTGMTPTQFKNTGDVLLY